MRRLLPSGLLPRIRLAALVLGGITLFIQLAQVGNSTKGPRITTLMSLRAQPVHALTVVDGDEVGLALALAVGGVLGTGIVLQGVRAPDASQQPGVIAVQGDGVAPEMTAGQLTAWLAAVVAPGPAVDVGATISPA